MSPKESEKITTAYKNEHNRLLGYIRKRIPVSEEAEDILQDVFYQLTVGFNDIRRIENLTAWLYKVADNRITDIFRKDRRYNKHAHLKKTYAVLPVACRLRPTFHIFNLFSDILFCFDYFAKNTKEILIK